MSTPLVYTCEPRKPNGFVKGRNGNRSMPTNHWAKKYILYMGRREGVSKHDALNHGLFGKLDNNDSGEFGAIKNISKTAEYVKRKVEEGTWLYDNIVSIAKEDFERLGYDNKEAWQQLAKDNAIKMADAVGIPASRVEYVAAMHIHDGKPNFHLLFWDKEQGIRSYFNYAKTFEKIRAGLTKYVYQDDLKLLSEAKTVARDTILEEIKLWNKETFDPIYQMSKNDFNKVRDRVSTDPISAVGKVLNRNIPNSYLDEMRIKIIQLMEKLPQAGRLSYGFLPPTVKKEVDKLAKDIIKDLANNNPDFKIEFETYKKAARDMATLYDSDISKHELAEKKAEADLTKRLANQLLKFIKNINHNQYLYGKDENNKAYNKQKAKTIQRNITINLLSELFRGSRDENKRGQDKLIIGKSDRIEARREKAKNMESSSIRWGGDSHEI